MKSSKTICKNKTKVVTSKLLKRNFSIDIVGTCNLRCPSCPVGNIGSRESFKNTRYMDKELFEKSRVAKILCTTPRVGLNIINESGIFLDGLIGSNLDPGEVFSLNELRFKPKYVFKTEGEYGGIVFPGGRYKAIKTKKNKVDSYGCGDSFAAGILYGMSSNWNIEESLNLAKIMGRNCSEHFGPYKNVNN